jgi:hypothetical protein
MDGVARRTTLAAFKMAVEAGAVLAVIGGVLVHLTFGTLYTFG